MREPRLGYSLSPKFELYTGGTLLEVQSILDTIKRHQIHKFVEIGIYEGGLAERILLDTSCDYLGIEIDPTIIDKNIKSDSEFRAVYGDCMNPDILEYVKGFMSAVQGHSLVYCDGGNKKEEIKVYAPLLAKGDVLLTHDFWEKRWDIVDYPDYQYQEVTIRDVKFLDRDNSFERMADFWGTRLVGWVKC
jgi:hypothetical protein